MGCEQMNDTINTDTLLPVGERLKPLLSKSCISESDMKNILAERGVYIGDSDKKSSIPILTLSILSPREFEKLQELQKTKEDSLKTKIIKAKSQSDKNLNNLIPQDLVKRDDLIDEYDCFDFDTDLSFNMDDQNKLVLDYTIIREDVTKDWANNKSRYTGRVEIEKSATQGMICFRNEYTSSETEVINKKIIKMVTNHLQILGEISNKESPFEITSDKFNNIQRFAFMLQLANDSPSGFLSFEAVKNIEIGPDRKVNMPDNTKWMGGSVKNIIINSEKGKTLENIEYISDKQYHEFLILRKVQAQYKFSFGVLEGQCIVEYGFPHYFRSHVRNHSFEVSVPKIYFSKDSKSENSRNASRFILKEFQDMIQQKYDSILGS
jgi:hypothetical protein